MIKVIVGVLLLGGLAQEEPQARDGVRIRVAPSGWGEANPADVEKVLESAGACLWQHARGRPPITIEVSRTQGDPITLFNRGPSGEIRIKLDAEGFHWAQYAFQFAHEVGHVFCGYADYPNPNLWFEETLCETASLFALGRMAKAWETTPPYPNWKSFAPSLVKYRDERLGRSRMPEGTSLRDWFREHEEALRSDPRGRDRNLLMASALLPLFEEDPGRWDAVGSLNQVRGDPSRRFPQYLKDWSLSSPEKHRPFIRAVADRFGVTLSP